MNAQRSLGHNGKNVTAIGLGAMPLSLDGRPDEKIAVRVIETFLENGGNFIDTANVYCIDDNDIGHNERLIYKTLEKLGKLDNVIVATKGGLRRPEGGWHSDGDPVFLRQSCEKSLKDLNTDSIFLYQLHAPDPKISITESVGELARLRVEGKIQHIGLSNVNTDEIMAALAIAPVLTVQNRCNILERKSFENNIVDLCKREGIVFIPHSPVGGHFNHARLTKSKLLVQTAKKYGVSVYQIALSWLLHKGDHILPIPGASKINSIKDSLLSIKLDLDQNDLETLDQLV